MSEAAHRDYQGAKIGHVALPVHRDHALRRPVHPIPTCRLPAYPEDFHDGEPRTERRSRAWPTPSSCSPAASPWPLAIVAIQRGEQRGPCVWLRHHLRPAALVFLVNKAVEWGPKFHHGIYPERPGPGHTAPG